MLQCCVLVYEVANFAGAVSCATKILFIQSAPGGSLNVTTAPYYASVQITAVKVYITLITGSV
jgi:hypothetical protein